MKKITQLLFCFLMLAVTAGAQTYEYARSYAFGSGPRGLTVHQNKLYTALNGAKKIVISSLDGQVEKEVKCAVAPIDVDVDAQGRLLIANRDAQTVVMMNTAGEELKSISFTEKVYGVTVRKNGNVYVASLTAVHVFDAELNPITTITALSMDKFREVRKVYFDAADQMFIVDRNTGTYKISSYSGNMAQVDYLIKKNNNTSAGSTTFNRLAYMTTTANGNLIISAEETYNNSLLGVYRFDKNGTLIDVIGTLGAATGEDRFQSVYGIATDESDNLYVVDYKSNAIRVWEAKDLSAPVITDLKTASDARGSVNMTFAIDEKATVHYLLRPATATVPTAQELKNGNSVAISQPQAGGVINIAVDNQSEQVVYLLAVDAAGNQTEVMATTPFVVETELKLSSIFVLEKQTNGATVEFATNDNGTLYWTLLDADAQTPSHEQIQNGILSGSAQVVTGKKQTISVRLPEKRRYRLFVFLQKEHEQTAVASLRVMPEDDAEIIYQRYFSLIKGDNPDYSDPLILARYEAIRSNVAKARQKLPSYQWQEGLPAIDLNTGREGRDIAGAVLLPLALNYHLEGPKGAPNADFQSASALKEITDLYDYMEKRGMIEGCNIQFASSGSFLGLCGYYYASLLMREELLRSGQWETVEKMMAWMSRQVNPTDPEWGAEVENNGSRSDGVRTLYHNRLMAICAQTDENMTREEDLAYLLKALNQNMRVSPAWDGFIKPDFTGYHHHGPWGNAYNTDALHTSAQMAMILNGTRYALNEESIYNLAESLLAFRAYCGKYDISRGMCGRFPNSLNGLANNVPAFAYLYEALNGEMQQRIGGALNRLFTPEYSGIMQHTVRDVTADIAFHGGMGMLQQTIRVKALGLRDNETALMNRVFPYSGMQVHRRDEWMAVVKSYTKYVWDFETNEEQNWLGRNQSAGALSIYATPDAEGTVTAAASGVGYNGWDWSHVPGTTSFDMPIDSIIREATLYTMAKFSPSAIAGGVELEGKHGVYGMIFNDIRQAYSYNGNKWGTKWRGVTLSANKSWFFFDDEIVALGSDIKNIHESFDAHTTLFQNTLATTATPFYLNGEAITGLDYSQDITDNRSVVLTDVVGNAYLIPDAAGLHLHRATQNSVQDRNYNTKTSGNYATAWFDHGRAASASYHYLIRVGGAEAAKSLSTLPTLPYRIEQQDKQAHIVSYPAKSMRGYAIFAKGDLADDVYLASADKPCMIMLRENGSGSLRFSLSNPELGFYPEDKFPYQVWSIDKNKLYAPSVEQPVTVVLKGKWALSNASPQISVIGYDAATDRTTLLFNGKDAVSMEADLEQQTVGLDDAVAQQKVIYGPNPCEGQLNLRFAHAGDHRVEMTDMTGRTVYRRQHTGTQTTVDTSALPAGSYLLLVDGVVAGKMMKK
ncbi:MAG: chondroitinase family polysaccharide lyase [Bacteroidales bacterium]